MSDKLQEIRERILWECDTCGHSVDRRDVPESGEYDCPYCEVLTYANLRNEERQRAESAESRLLLAEKLLRRLFDETDAMYQDYESGVDCYSGGDSANGEYLGKALKISAEDRLIAVLNETESALSAWAGKK